MTKGTLSCIINNEYLCNLANLSKGRDAKPQGLKSRAQGIMTAGCHVILNVYGRRDIRVGRPLDFQQVVLFCHRKFRSVTK